MGYRNVPAHKYAQDGGKLRDRHVRKLHRAVGNQPVDLLPAHATGKSVARIVRLYRCRLRAYAQAQ